ncbi:hypothetical protein MOMA_02635 [Moraxella macacae 0408225]|uniref:Uncharacterized protein n=1 Tax=Moraxella macacae 0408225 TaxID=1230338 RepID=L2F925_9GAMM|nr:hypothetical protein [Moraxella macacae]ELA09266.1 hypothetical protein MOMA_02635 [Moraxella macacae 0408225]
MAEDFDFEYYKSIDFSNARSVRLNPKIKAFQDRKKEYDRIFLGQFDLDVQEIINQHNNPKDRERLNTVIRALFATA